MIYTWTMGPIAAAVALGNLGFSWQEANRLVQLKLRCEHGAFRVMWTSDLVPSRTKGARIDGSGSPWELRIL